MTTSDKLNKLLETKQAIKQAIIIKGIDVADDEPFAWYADKIYAISSGGSDNFLATRTLDYTDFSYLFYNHKGSYLDVYSFNTSNATNMEAMFYSCPNLTVIDGITYLDTSNVINMGTMFAANVNLKFLTLNSWNTYNVTNMSAMFAYCSSLTYLNISEFNMDNVIDSNAMFEGCYNLKELRLDNCNYSTISKIINSSGFPTGQVNVDGEYINRTMYVQEANATGLMAPDGWEFVYVESSEGGVPGIPEGPVIPPEPSEPEEPTEPTEPTETYVISFSTLGSKKLTVNNVDVTDQVVETGGYGDTISCKYETTEVIRQASFKDNTDLVRVFGLDTSMMFHTEEMFSGCTNLVAILPMLDSSMVYSTRAMFKNCTSLTSINTIGSFTAASNKSEMFYNCTSLTGTVPSWNYWLNGAVTEYADCFYNCTMLDNYSDIPTSWGGSGESSEPSIPTPGGPAMPGEGEITGPSTGDEGPTVQ